MKRRPAPEALDRFYALVAEAAAVTAELRKLDTPQARKLSVTAWPREALQISGMSEEQLARFRERVTLEHTPALFGRLRFFAREIASENFPTPAKDAARLRYLMKPDSSAELSALGANVLDLQALAAQIASQNFPLSFGQAESTESMSARLRDTKLKRDLLFERIGNEFEPKDLLLSDWTPDGRARATFALSGGAVSIVPKENAGERLTNWFLQQPRKEEDV